MISAEDELAFRELWQGDLFEIPGQHGTISIAPEYQALFDEIAPTLPAKITLIPPIEYELHGYEQGKLHYLWQT